MDEKNQLINMKIKMQETEQTKLPTDTLNVNLQLARSIEQNGEYIEDEFGIIARNPVGQLYRMKLKMTLSNQGKPGASTTGFYSNV